jgi:indole-3-glycerol phosphate synthase
MRATMSVLDSIIEGVRQDLAARRLSLHDLQEKLDQAPQPIDPHLDLRGDLISIIAEVKRSSPSKGNLAKITDPAALAHSYEEAGASVISVLTEKRRFGGSLDDLVAVRSAVSIPILRKDFMIDEYQFYEARAFGADIVLLIVAALSSNQLKDYYEMATELGMASLVEVHTHEELERAMEIEPRIIGVNSRNLKTLDVDQRAFTELIPEIPETIIRVAESGISTRSEVEHARGCGADVILVGEALVRAGDPISALRALRGL